MQIIPVIDLAGGRAVHARAGRREDYLPARSALCRDGDALALAAAYLALADFPILYVADLDAILERGSNADILREMCRRFSGVTIWLDAGPATPALAGAGVRAVLGSESGIDAACLATAPQPVLSLDFGAAGFMGDAALLHSPETWPDDVIVMSLPRVGTGAGPDLITAGAIAAQAGPARRVYLGGGVRDAADLGQASAAGLHGALVATALHEGRLDRRAL